MITVIFIVAACAAFGYFLFDFLDKKFVFPYGSAKIPAAILFAIAGLFVAGFLNDQLCSLIPPDNYEITTRTPLQPIKDSIGNNVYAAIEGDDVVFVQQIKIGKLFLVRRKKDEIKEIISFLPKDSTVSPQLIDLKAKRSGFWKYFFLDTTKYKFLIPPSGIKEGEVKFVERYEFFPEK